MIVRWLVVVQRDADPVEVCPFDQEGPARDLYDLLALSWSGVFLARVVAGPRDETDPAAGRRDEKEG